MKNDIVIETKDCNIWNIDWRRLIYSFLNKVNLYELQLENQYEKKPIMNGCMMSFQLHLFGKFFVTLFATIFMRQ